MICGWLLACLSVAACSAHTFQFWLLVRCVLLVARVLLPVLRQGRPFLRSVLPACLSMACHRRWLCAIAWRLFVVVTAVSVCYCGCCCCSWWLSLCVVGGVPCHLLTLPGDSMNSSLEPYPCPGSDNLDASLGERRRCLTSVCELERCGVRRPLKHFGRVVRLPILSWLVLSRSGPQMDAGNNMQPLSMRFPSNDVRRHMASS